MYSSTDIDPPAPTTHRRRVVFLVLNTASLALLVAMMLKLILGGGATVSEWIIGAGFLLTIPYVVIGFWNSVIGLWLLHVRPETIRAMPGVAELAGPAPTLHCATALVMTLHNEVPAPIFERLSRMRASLAATGQQARFTFVVLSDSNRKEIVDAEASCFAAFRDARKADEPLPRYRRRTNNHGYKAGNIYDFIKAHGEDFEYFVPLDSDSLIAGGVLVRMVGAMDKRPQIGILQGLVVGMPSSSAFTRVFQFGMRHGMRVFTAGSAWWTADCGSYWGHNAVIRTQPFHSSCQLPELSGNPPFGGAILSHDQVESESYEINPPTLLDFIRRELRWCQGNMQYFRLLGMRGLKVTSRIQLSIAIGMYLGQAAWIAMIVAGCIGSMVGNFHFYDLRLGMVLFIAVFCLSVAPKLCGALDVWLGPSRSKGYGGSLRFAASVFAELVSSTLMAPTVALSVALFLIGLVFGKGTSWRRQNRDQLAVPWRRAALVMAPHTVAGAALTAALWSTGGLGAALWGLPLIAGLVLAAPYTRLGANAAAGHWLRAMRLFSIPEEQRTPLLLAGPPRPRSRRIRLRAARRRARRRAHARLRHV